MADNFVHAIPIDGRKTHQGSIALEFITLSISLFFSVNLRYSDKNTAWVFCQNPVADNVVQTIPIDGRKTDQGFIA